MIDEKQAKVFKDVAESLAKEVFTLKLEQITTQEETSKIELEKNQMNIERKKSNILYRKEAERVEKLNETNHVLKQKNFLIDNEKKSVIKKANAEIKEHLLENKQLQSRFENLHNKFDEKGKELKRTAAREKYMRIKIAKLDNQKDQESQTIESLRKELEEAQIFVQNMRITISNLENENQQLNEIVNEINNETIDTFDNNRKCFTTDLQMCIYKLLEHHVSSAHVSAVIETVLKLAGKKASKLPSKSTINNMNIQRLSLCHKQLFEVLPTKSDTCLYTDETMKYGEKFGGYHISDSENTMYVLGLRSLPSKSASDTLSVFNEILSDIQSSSSADNNNQKNAILSHIKSTMSDRAATEIKFSKLLEEFRGEILPLATDNCPAMSDEEKLCIERLYNFFCGLHQLIHMANTCESTIAEIEKAHFDTEPGWSIDKSSTSRLLRTAAKLVGRGADEKSGCHLPFKTFCQNFLKEHKLNSVPVEPYRGNRFNVTFSNAAGLYFIHEKLQHFLSFNCSNRLMTSVRDDLKQPFLLSAIKALGLICYQVTSPLWCLVEDKEIHIMDMNRYYLSLVNFLRDASQNISDFLQGSLLPFGDETKIHKDAIYERLVTPDENLDGDVETILSLLMPALCKLCMRIYKDHLPGGTYENFTNEMKEETKSVVKHNKFAEMAFGYLDQLMKFKPNIKTLASESYLMFCHNKTMDWLENKSSEDQQKIVEDARKDVRGIRMKYNERKKKIEEARLKMLAEKKQKQIDDLIKKNKNLESLTKEMLLYGLWQSETEIRNRINLIKTVADKIKALKVQLSFREKVLMQRIEDFPGIFLFTRKVPDKTSRQNLPIEELMHNLIKLVNQACTVPLEIQDEIAGKKFEHTISTDDQPIVLVGTVISQVPGFQDWYNVVYEGEDAVKSIKLKDEQLRIL